MKVAKNGLSIPFNGERRANAPIVLSPPPRLTPPEPNLARDDSPREHNPHGGGFWHSVWAQKKSVVMTVNIRPSRNPAVVIDAKGISKYPARINGQKGIQVNHAPARIKKSVAISACRSNITNDIAGRIDTSTYAAVSA